MRRYYALAQDPTFEEAVKGLRDAKKGIMEIIQQDPDYTNNISSLGGAFDGGRGAAWLELQKALCEYVTIEQTVTDPTHLYTTTTTTGFPVCADAGDPQHVQLQHFFEMLDEFWHHPATLAVLMDHAAYTSSHPVPSAAQPLR